MFGYSVKKWLLEWLLGIGIDREWAFFLRTAIIILIIVIICCIANKIAKVFITSFVGRLIKKSKNKWDDIFLEKGVFNRLSHFIPALIIYYTAGFALSSYREFISPVQLAVYIYMIIIMLLVINSVLNALHEVYLNLPVSKDRSIKGYVQVVKIIFYGIGIILIFSILLGSSPLKILAGLGALAAVLMLVFKDTIIGLVSGIQLTANNMVKIGDWISIPNQNTDGVVTEISLNTIKIQNWDKSISSIPVYTLVSNAFINWKGLEESGARRIKRSVSIDMKSIKFCDAAMTGKFKKIELLKDYIESKGKELENYNKQNNIDDSVLVNGRRMTNIGAFRKYVELYLKNHSKIRKDMPVIVRQLQPDNKGLPVEIYVFSNDTEWANYESIQSDIFDHILSIVPEFELKVFQSLSND